MDKTFVDRSTEIAREVLYSSVRQSLPAEVINVSEYSSKQCIDVIPLIPDWDEDGEVVQLPAIYKVPVCLEEGGGALISLPVKVGDRVKIDFSKVGLDAYLHSAGKEILTPSDKRVFSITDCFARLGCPTFVSNLSPDPDNVEIKFSGSSIKMKPNGDVEETVAGNRIFNVTGDFKINSSSLTHNDINVGDTHVHSQDPDSDGNTQVNTNGPQ